MGGWTWGGAGGRDLTGRRESEQQVQARVQSLLHLVSLEPSENSPRNEARETRVPFLKRLMPKEVEWPAQHGTAKKMLGNSKQSHRAVRRHQADLGGILALALGMHFITLSIHLPVH